MVERGTEQAFGILGRMAEVNPGAVSLFWEEDPEFLKARDRFNAACASGPELARRAMSPTWDELHVEPSAQAFGRLSSIVDRASPAVGSAPSNTDPTNSQCDRLVLGSPESYSGQSGQSWASSDPELFAGLSQGGGGIDWLSVNVFGKLNELGRAFVKALRHVRESLACGSEDFAADAAEVGFGVLAVKQRKEATLTHPRFPEESFVLSAHGTGNGRNYQPFLVRFRGIALRFGRLEDSLSGGEGVSAPIGAVEIPGTVWLREGDKGALDAADGVARAFGIDMDGARAVRVDLAADLPGAQVAEFLECLESRNAAWRREAAIAVHYSSEMVAQTVSVRTGAVHLRIYDKLAEASRAGHEDQLALMKANRWGGDVDSAVRVEFQIALGQLRAKRYASLAALLEGLGDLLAWCCNKWIRLCDHVTDRTHISRSGYADCWLRTLHAFAFWGSRLGERAGRPVVKSAPPSRLLAQAVGCLKSACARMGILPADDKTVFGVVETWVGFNELARQCCEAAIALEAKRGVRAVPKTQHEIYMESPLGRGPDPDCPF